MRKVVALIVAIIMVLTLVPALAFAEESVVPTENTPVVEEKEDENQQIYEPEERKEATENLAEDEQEKESLEEDDQSEEGLTNEEPLPEETGTENLLGDSPEISPIWYDNDQSDYVETENDADPSKITEAVKTVSKALSDLGANSSDVESFSSIMGKISSGASIVGGGIAILQMIGFIDDPSTTTIKHITTLLEQQELSLNEMKKTLNDLATEMSKMHAEARLNQRANMALKYTDRWFDYQKDFLYKMDQYITQYKTNLIQNISDWAYSTKHENLYTYYTMVNGKKTQTYSKKLNMDLDVSDGGEKIEKEYTIGLPGSYIDDALKDYREKKLWNADTFRKDIVPLLGTAIYNAMEDPKGVQLGCSKSFIERWKAQGADKKAIANEVAVDMLNSEAFVSSCDAVCGKSATSAATIALHLTQTWARTSNQLTGVASLIEPMKLTHCFEGEVKADINKVYSSFTALISWYSLFCMTIASQSNTMLSPDKIAVRDNWVKYMEWFTTKSKSELIGYDNYCYLTGTLLQTKDFKMEASSSITIEEYDTPSRGWWERGYRGHTADKWKVTTTDINNILDGINAQVLYQTWQKNNTGKDKTKDFKEYLIKNNTNTKSAGYRYDYILTSYKGANTFSLSDGITMTCGKIPCWHKNCEGDYYKEGQTVDIMTDKERIDETVLHDKVLADTFNLVKGTDKKNDAVVSRAMFCKDKWRWRRCECYYFSPTQLWSNWSVGTYYRTEGLQKRDYTKWHYETDFSMVVLACVDVPKKKVESAEGEYVPNELVEEMATYEVIDTAYYAHEDEDILSREDWNKLNIDYTEIPDDSAEYLKSAEEYIDSYLLTAAKEGKTVSLSETEKENLAKQMLSMTQNAGKNMDANVNINNAAYLDPFGLYGNNAVMEKLAKNVLPDNQIATDGQTMDPVANMITAAFYEPFVSLDCVKEGNDYVLKPVLMYNVVPYLMVWCDHIKSYDFYLISDEVMQKLGLSMNLRLNASDAGDNDLANIIHYDDDMNVVENKIVKIQGSGNNRYAELSVSKCSPFYISYSSTNTAAVKTGDESDIMIWYIVLALSAAIIVAFVIAARRSRKNSK